MTTPKERPILFSGEEVQATLAGRKKQFRRPIKPQHIPSGVRTLRFENQNAEELMHVARCPYGAPGDRLWVRETWAKYDGQYYYRATSHIHAVSQFRWRPSTSMPRDACRLILRVTDVRVQRVQEISEEDAVAEGWQKRPKISGDPSVHRDAARDWFMDVWDETYGPVAWLTNDFVWAIGFEVVK